MPFPSDLEIARKAELKPLTDIAKESGIPESSLELYGEGAAKIKLDAIEAMADKPKAKYVVVTAITPTPPVIGDERCVEEKCSQHTEWNWPNRGTCQSN